MKKVVIFLSGLIGLLFSITSIASEVHDGHKLENPAKLASVSGYVCEVRGLIPNDNAYGDFGNVYASLHNGPNCTGGYMKHVLFCSVNATSSSCPTSISYLYTESQMNTLFRALQQAGSEGKRVRVFDNSCGTSSVCAAYAYIGS